MARRPSLRGFWPGESGASAVEFVLVLPLTLLLTIGTIYLSLMLYATTSLHYAVEDAARCRSVKTAICTDATATETYAASRYKGPRMGAAFTATQPACGNQVAGSGSFTMRTGLRTFSVPITATACFPS